MRIIQSIKNVFFSSSEKKRAEKKIVGEKLYPFMIVKPTRTLTKWKKYYAAIQDSAEDENHPFKVKLVNDDGKVISIDHTRGYF